MKKIRGVFIDSTDQYQNFKELYEDKYFVDKTNIIKKFNEILNTPIKNVCITKPRRFGKSSIASMIIAYYSKREKEEFKKIFDNLNISKNEKDTNTSKRDKDKNASKKDKDTNTLEKENFDSKKRKSKYEETMGKYHTIYIDFSKYHEGFEFIKDYLSRLEDRIIYELKEYIESDVILNEIEHLFELFNIKSNKLAIFLDYLFSITREKFVFIIDEWDYIFSHNKYTIKERDDFLIYLQNLLKSKAYVALTYMTGILPITKRSSGSAYNFFLEYSMLKDDLYYEYFGFTEEEVAALCKINGKLELKEMKDWYNGYNLKNKNIFNTYSIINALRNDSTGYYWINTGTMEEIRENINFNIYGVRDDFLKLITHDKIKVELNGYGTENKQKQVENEETKQSSENMRNKMYSLMVAYGFLNYYEGEIRIPNKELLEKYKMIMSDESDFDIYKKLMNESKKILEATLTSNIKEICQILQKVYEEKSIIKGDYNHITLEFIIKFAYFDAQNTYEIKQEETKGQEYVDFIFIPKHKNENKTAIILELKVGKSAKETINQIYEKEYHTELKELGYKILIVGINCIKEKNKYDCIIEEFDDNKIKQKQNNNNIDEDNNNQNQDKSENNIGKDNNNQNQNKRRNDIDKVGNNQNQNKRRNDINKVTNNQNQNKRRNDINKVTNNQNQNKRRNDIDKVSNNQNQNKRRNDIDKVSNNQNQNKRRNDIDKVSNNQNQNKKENDIDNTYRLIDN
ncbi:hypothetical protein PIROE2DRAFT_4902 [Piromyces sp. E2]|nr:hypothetical protein PIROE2DRAFT_4902 [Piromyces sp. E2]|eukprot:OUM67614.1 hypothetical protein PIROE2DRAFT_4902 [Piromyces sp. E2]